MTRTRSIFLTLLAILLSPTAANATLMRLDFSVSATSGPLSGVVGSGYGIFDDSIAPAGGGTVLQAGLFQNFNFSWNRINYDATTANTGALGFDALGSLTTVLFGSNCAAGSCSVASTSTNWFVANNRFIYGYGSGIGQGAAKWATSAVAVPEPGTLTLLSMGLLVVGAARRRKTV